MASFPPLLLSDETPISMKTSSRRSPTVRPLINEPDLEDLLATHAGEGREATTTADPVPEAEIPSW